MAAASSVPITSLESVGSVTRRHSRSGTFARTWASSAPAGRCVASTRWMPSERPWEASRISAGSTSGRSSRRARSSSTTTTSRGGAGPRARSASRSPTPAPARSRSRRASSARTPVSARSAALGSRSVTSPTTWGSPWHAPSPAPPLKSTSITARRSGPYRAASASTSVWSSSDLPAPVVPATSRCGPSARRSTVTGPPAPIPIGALRPAGPGPARRSRSARLTTRGRSAAAPVPRGLRPGLGVRPRRRRARQAPLGLDVDHPAAPRGDLVASLGQQQGTGSATRGPPPVQRGVGLGVHHHEAAARGRAGGSRCAVGGRWPDHDPRRPPAPVPLLGAPGDEAHLQRGVRQARAEERPGRRERLRARAHQGEPVQRLRPPRGRGRARRRGRGPPSRRPGRPAPSPPRASAPRAGPAWGAAAGPAGAPGWPGRAARAPGCAAPAPSRACHRPVRARPRPDPAGVPPARRAGGPGPARRRRRGRHARVRTGRGTGAPVRPSHHQVPRTRRTVPCRSTTAGSLSRRSGSPGATAHRQAPPPAVRGIRPHAGVRTVDHHHLPARVAGGVPGGGVGVRDVHPAALDPRLHPGDLVLGQSPAPHGQRRGRQRCAPDELDQARAAGAELDAVGHLEVADGAEREAHDRRVGERRAVTPSRVRAACGRPRGAAAVDRAAGVGPRPPRTDPPPLPRPGRALPAPGTPHSVARASTGGVRDGGPRGEHRGEQPRTERDHEHQAQVAPRHDERRVGQLAEQGLRARPAVRHAQHRAHHGAHTGHQQPLHRESRAQLAAGQTDGPQRGRLPSSLDHRQRQGVGHPDHRDHHGHARAARRRPRGACRSPAGRRRAARRHP